MLLEMEFNPILIKLPHGMFIVYRVENTVKSLYNIPQFFSCLLDEGIAKICVKVNSHNGFLKVGQDRPSSQLNFLHIFVIPLSSGYKKWCQMSERLLAVFHHSRNIPWEALRWLLFFIPVPLGYGKDCCGGGAVLYSEHRGSDVHN